MIGSFPHCPCLGTWGAVEDPSALTAVGVEATTAYATGNDVLTAVQQALPIVQSTIAALSDPYRRYERAKARLANAKARGASASTVRRLTADVRAAEAALDIREESLDATRRWRTIGHTGGTALVLVGSVVGLSLAGFLVAGAIRVLRAH